MNMMLPELELEKYKAVKKNKSTKASSGRKLGHFEKLIVKIFEKISRWKSVDFSENFH